MSKKKQDRAISVMAGIAVAAVAAVCLALYGCQPKPAAAALAGTHAIPFAYNPVDCNKQHEAVLLALLHDKLTQVDPATGRVVPALAETIARSDDAKTWTFALRRDARDPNGTACTAADVVFSLNLYLNASFGCSRRANLLSGGQPIAVEAVDESTVRIRANSPAPHLDWVLTDFNILPKAAYAGIASDPATWKAALGRYPDTSLLCGFGPYRAAGLTANQLVLERNANFYGRDDAGRPLPYVARIELTLLDDPAAAMREFQGNARLNYRELRDPVEADGYAGSSEVEVRTLGPTGATSFVWLNQNPNAPGLSQAKARLFQSVEFRRALASAIDRTAVASRAYGGHAEPLYGPVSPAYAHALPAADAKAFAPPYEPKLVASGFAALGLRQNGSGFWEYREDDGSWKALTIPLVTTPSPGEVRKLMADAVRDQWRAVGIDASSAVIDFNDAVDRILNTKQYVACLMFLEGSPAPANSAELFLSSSRMHFHAPSQPTPRTNWEREVDQAMAAFLAEKDPTRAQESFAKVQRVWIESAAFTYLVVPHQKVVVRAKAGLRGLAPNGRAGHPVLDRGVVERVELTGSR